MKTWQKLPIGGKEKRLQMFKRKKKKKKDSVNKRSTSRKEAKMIAWVGGFSSFFLTYK